MTTDAPARTPRGRAMPTRRLAIQASLAVAATLVSVGPSHAQTVERRVYAASADMRRDLDAHGIDGAQFEDVVNGIAEGLSAGDLAPLLARSAPDLRVTAGRDNVVVPKDRLGAYGERLLKVPGLRADVMDEAQAIIHDGKVGLARGTIWIGQRCLDEACSRKRSEIVTLNLP